MNLYPWGGASKLPHPPGVQPGSPYRYILEANAENVQIRLGSIGIDLYSEGWSTHEVMLTMGGFKKGGCLMVRDGRASIIPPK